MESIVSIHDILIEKRLEQAPIQIKYVLTAGRHMAEPLWRKIERSKRHRMIIQLDSIHSNSHTNEINERHQI